MAEHPFGGSWGYQVTSYYAPTSRFGSPDDFRYLVDALHRAGIGVIVDWVPAHFPKDGWALGRFDGTALYEHSDPRRGEQLDWGTYVFDFGRPEVRNFLVATRCIGCRSSTSTVCGWMRWPPCSTWTIPAPVGGWTPNIYGGRENLEAVAVPPGDERDGPQDDAGMVTVAEESTSWPGVTPPDEPWRPWFLA